MSDNHHPILWEQFILNHRQNRLAQVILIQGAHYLKPVELAQRMSAAILCYELNKPCKVCRSCYLLSLNEHPDLTYISSEKSDSVIKIEQIRAVNTQVFTASALGNNRVVIITPAENLTISASNALLKILEEPPNNVYFILVAEHITTLPATILSRCQTWRLSATHYLQESYLSRDFFKDNESNNLFDQLDELINDLLSLKNHVINSHWMAAKWINYEFKGLIELIYLINAEMIKEHLVNKMADNSLTMKKLKQLAGFFKPQHLFIQMDKLHVIIKNLNQMIAVNKLLTLEDILLSYAITKTNE